MGGGSFDGDMWTCYIWSVAFFFTIIVAVDLRRTVAFADDDGDDDDDYDDDDDDDDDVDVDDVDDVEEVDDVDDVDVDDVDDVDVVDVDVDVVDVWYPLSRCNSFDFVLF